MWFLLKPVLLAAEIGLVFVILELLWPAKPRPTFSWRRYRTDLLHIGVGGALIKTGVAVVTVAATTAIGSADIVSAAPYWVQFVLVLLLGDLTVYLVHRAFHTVPLLWEFHKVHHSSEQLDWLSTYRVHPLEQILTASAVIVPPLLLGFAPGVVAVYSLGYWAQVHLIHSNVNLSLGPLARVLTGPGFHHWHHAGQEEAYDRNFGAQLVIWDRLFGTCYAAPQPRPERYGVDDAPAEGFVSHLIAPFAARRGAPTAKAEAVAGQ